MRILHVSPYYPPDRIGGVGEVVRHIHRGLVLRGLRSMVLTSGTSREDPLVHRIGNMGPKAFALTSWRGGSLLGDFDLLHIHHGEAVALQILNRLTTRRPVLLTLHTNHRQLRRAYGAVTVGGERLHRSKSDFFQYWVNAPIKSWLDRLAAALSDAVSAVSHSVANDTPFRATKKPIVVLNGVHDGLFSHADSGLPTSDLVYVGNGGMAKRAAVLPRILELMSAGLGDPRLRIVGLRPEQERRLVAAFGDLGLEHQVVSEGIVSQAQVQQFLSVSKLLIVPSAYEGFGMVIAEAAKYGVPTVASDVGGIPEIVRDGVDGILVSPDDPQGFADACVRILDAPQLRQRLGSSARSRVLGEFLSSRQVDDYIAIYRSLIDRTQPDSKSSGV